MQYSCVDIENMFPDGVLQKSEGGMKEDEEIYVGIFTPWFSCGWFWTNRAGDSLFDFT